MKDYEKIVKAMELCAKEDIDLCEECPYTGCCQKMKTDAVELFEEMKAQLEQPKTACDYELTFKAYEADIRKLNDELSRVNAEYERTECDLHRAEVELIHLRAVKATAEAFLGVKIDGQM